MLKKLKIYYTIILVLAMAGLAGAQQLPLTGQYLFNPYALNPAFAGSMADAELFFNYRKDWVNITGSPQTYSLNGSGRVYENMYLGGEILADQADIFYRFKGTLSYTYRLQMEKGQFLSFGLNGKIFQSVVRFDQVNADLNDPVLRDLTRVTGTSFNAGFGLIYNKESLHIGLGMPILFPTRDAYMPESEGRFAFEQAFHLFASDRYSLSHDWQIQPFLVYRKTRNEPGSVDVSAMAIYLDRFWMSGLYRNSSLIALGIGGELYQGFIFNYSYEIGLGGINYRSGGSHEISIGYRINRGDGPGRDRGIRPGRGATYPQVIDFNSNRRNRP